MTKIAGFCSTWRRRWRSKPRSSQNHRGQELIAWHGSTIVRLDEDCRIGAFMAARPMCNELDRCRRRAASALLEAKRIRLSRDVSIYEDAELCREGHSRICAL